MQRSVGQEVNKKNLVQLTLEQHGFELYGSIYKFYWIYGGEIDNKII